MTTKTNSPLFSLTGQYFAVEEMFPKNTIVLMRIGDFYEAFGERAKKIAGLINTTLTTRNHITMTGFPIHALYKAVGQILDEGFGVVVLDYEVEKKTFERLVDLGFSPRVVKHFYSSPKTRYYISDKNKKPICEISCTGDPIEFFKTNYYGASEIEEPTAKKFKF